VLRLFSLLPHSIRYSSFVNFTAPLKNTMPSLVSLSWQVFLDGVYSSLARVEIFGGISAVYQILFILLSLLKIKTPLTT
jgi:hypothetical protein